MGIAPESRIEVRLDDRHRRMLDRIVERRSITISALIRGFIEEEERRLEDEEFLALLAGLQAEPIDLPPPEELRRELEEAYCPRIGCDEH